MASSLQASPPYTWHAVQRNDDDDGMQYKEMHTKPSSSNMCGAVHKPSSIKHTASYHHSQHTHYELQHACCHSQAVQRCSSSNIVIALPENIMFSHSTCHTSIVLTAGALNPALHAALGCQARATLLCVQCATAAKPNTTHRKQQRHPTPHQTYQHL
jgi:hypothetical protein